MAGDLDQVLGCREEKISDREGFLISGFLTPGSGTTKLVVSLYKGGHDRVREGAVIILGEWREEREAVVCRDGASQCEPGGGGRQADQAPSPGSWGGAAVVPCALQVEHNARDIP